jgi:hypothetical protein
MDMLCEMWWIRYVMDTLCDGYVMWDVMDTLCDGYDMWWICYVRCDGYVMWWIRYVMVMLCGMWWIRYVMDMLCDGYVMWDVMDMLCGMWWICYVMEWWMHYVTSETSPFNQRGGVKREALFTKGRLITINKINNPHQHYTHTEHSHVQPEVFCLVLLYNPECTVLPSSTV